VAPHPVAGAAFGAASSTGPLSTFDALLRVLSALVAKCLSKPAEDRYQSAAGLLYDLRAIAQLLRDCGDWSASPSTSLSTSSMLPSPRPAPSFTSSAASPSSALASFALGSRDANSALRISQRLYGREQDVATLIESFQRVVRTNKQIERGRVEDAAAPQLLLVSGYSGLVCSSTRQMHGRRANTAKGALMHADSCCICVLPVRFVCVGQVLAL